MIKNLVVGPAWVQLNKEQRRLLDKQFEEWNYFFVDKGTPLSALIDSIASSDNIILLDGNPALAVKMARAKRPRVWAFYKEEDCEWRLVN